MKHGIRKSWLGLIVAAALLLTPMTAAFADAATPAATLVPAEGFKYENDPRLNPSAMADVIVDPDAVYGFSPDPDSTRLGVYAEYDWSDVQMVADSRELRIAYHESMKALYDLKDQFEAEGKDIEEIARAVSYQRNVMRLEAYGDNIEGLEAAKASNLAAYGNEFGPTADSLYEKYGAWETVLEKAFSVNSGMDACLGLYDDYYDLYVTIGQIPDTFYSTAMQWAYSSGISTPITHDVYTPETLCTRAEAVTLLWAAAGCPTSETAECSFDDVNADSGCFNAVQWATEQGIIFGTAERIFAPEAVISRAQIVTILARAADADGGDCAELPFADVVQDAYYYDSVAWACENSIALGTSAVTFSPDALCTRAEAVTFLWRYTAREN